MYQMREALAAAGPGRTRRRLRARQDARCSWRGATFGVGASFAGAEGAEMVMVVLLGRSGRGWAEDGTVGGF